MSVHSVVQVTVNAERPPFLNCKINNKNINTMMDWGEGIRKENHARVRETTRELVLYDKRACAKRACAYH